MAERHHRTSFVARGLLRALCAALLALALGPVAAALAESPNVTIASPANGSLTNSSTPFFGGGTDDSFDEITVDISLAGGGHVRTLNTSPVGESWSVNPAQSLSDGEYTAQASQTNSLEETGHSEQVSFTVDTTPPSVTIEQPPARSKNSKPSFGGSASDSTGVVVRIYDSSHAEVASATTSGGGSWTASNESGLADGTYTAKAEQTDRAGNVGTSGTVTFTVDTTAPAVSLNSVSSPTNDPTPGFSGGAGAAPGDDASVRLNIYAGAGTSGSLVQTATTTPSGGSWSIGAVSTLAEGTYTAQAEQSDLAGNTARSGASTFVVKISGPAVSLTPVGTPTRNSTPSFSGGAGVASGDIASVRLNVYAGGTASGPPIRSVSATPSGASWSAGPVAALADGTYTAQAEQSDQAGNTAQSSPSTFRVDTVAPAVSLTPAPPASKSPTPGFSGAAGVAAGDLASVRLNIYAGSSPSGSPVQSIAVARSGSGWSVSAVAPLADGTYSAQAEQADEAGNSGVSAPSTFTIKTSAPAVSLTAVTSPTNNATLGFAGGAGSAPGDIASVKLKIYTGAAATGTPIRSVVATPSGATWSVAAVAALADGTYTAQAEQADEAGNTGKSAPSTFVVDTVAPAVSITTPGNGKVLDVSRPTFSGAAGTATGDRQAITLQIFAGESATGTPEQTVQIKPIGGSWTTGSTGPQLPTGTYTAVVKQSDAAGNVGTRSVGFKIATNSPVVTLTTSAVTRGSIRVTGASPSFSGSAATAPEDSRSVLLKIYSGTSSSSESLLRTIEVPVSGSTWSTGPIVALAEGAYTAQVEQQDSDPHQQTGVSASSTFTVDATSPNVTLTAPSGGSSSTDGSQAVSGTAGVAPGDLPDVTVRLFAGSAIAAGQSPTQTIQVASGAGSWSCTFAGLAPGTYTVRAEQSDDAGNTGVSGTATFSVVVAQSAAAAARPAASFSWSPSLPRAGEKVQLLSSSTDLASPINSYAWDLSGAGAFVAGGAVNSTSFSTPGKHLVQLRVGDAGGASSLAAETIEVGPARLPLIQPFPSVRITATPTASGILLRKLSVRAPAGVRVTVRCAGRGCPLRSLSKIATVGKTGLAPVEFKRLQRLLRAGVIIQVSAVEPGMIGKYTRLSIRRHKLPLRTDACLGPTGGKPFACPTS